MKERKPPWIKDYVSISDRAKRLQKLCDEEVERRLKGIPREHWKYAGVEEDYEPATKKVPYLRVVEAEIEVLETVEGGGGGGTSNSDKKPSWDFYFFVGTVGVALVLASYLLVDSLIRIARNLF